MMRLDEREWKPCRLSSIGNVEAGRDIYALERVKGNIPYITSGSQNNGIGYFVNNKNDTYDKGYIAVNRNGAVGLAFYHPYWSVMGNDCRKLHLLEADENSYVGIFVATAISMQNRSFSYSRKLGTGRANKLQIMLPVNDAGEPDYKFMEDYIRELMTEKKKQYLRYMKQRLMELCSIPDDKPVDWQSMINSHEWKPFYMSQIFDDSQRGKRIVNKNHIEGNTPLVSSQGVNNGVTNFVGNKDGVRRFKNCLSIANGGSSAGKCYYQPFEFVGSDHVTQCFRLNASTQQYLFLSLVVTKALMGKYGFSHEIKDKAIVRERILLPVNDDGQPDYDFMEVFGRKMMLAKYNQYLEYLKAGDQ